MDFQWTALIPLRSGSKRLPNKNILELNNKKLYQHTVDLAIQSGAEKIIISTDIIEILEDYQNDFVEVISRSIDLCRDDTPISAVLLETINRKKITGTVVLLQATSPLRNSQDINNALSLLSRREHDIVMSVTEADSSVLKWGQIIDNKFMPFGDRLYSFSNFQALPPVYKPNGAVYAMEAEWFVKNGGFDTKNIGTFIMPNERSIDIDSLIDFRECEDFLNKNWS